MVSIFLRHFGLCNIAEGRRLVMGAVYPRGSKPSNSTIKTQMTTEEKITPKEWLEKGKWTKFLQSLPNGQSTFEVALVGEYSLMKIRATASALSDRKYTITVDNNREHFVIRVSKNDDQEN